MIKKITVLFLIAIALTSCVSRKKIVYFQNVSSLSDNNYEPKVQPDDEVLIIVNVTSPNEALAAPFNQSSVVNLTPGAGAGQSGEGRTYRVDKDGFIQLPLVGSIKLGGLSRQQALEELNKEVKKYISNPIITLRVTNFKFTVLGEVKLPGTYTYPGERLTLPEALGLAGDLTVYGKRNNVLVIRDLSGKKTYNYIDLTKVDFMQSEFYYLSQNDLIYIEPNKTAVNSSATGRDLTIAISSLSVIIAIISIITR
ncbi:hypothetical protein Q765_07275 [Flavobacterium rivuli WB 3.3-2 = DSM 21788]|uniref:Uncharacterized protein n=1 Tax=Flavobacterium rivuli WB 3.3-2 = DSM 21788 TaxID=1121895 RepID=A0A0A2M5A6_9FLAO|nr:polysaccharide biosynthesis/export family protein [Flavobacterium rivuli]KGO87459.1 hypothetical protein Q765_07275 [Flavobacterium rivuli WB 3.3-2 = DSM 21788]